MKKCSKFFSIVVLILLCCGCFASCGSADEVKYCDGDFLKDMSKGLEARWSIPDLNDDNGNPTDEEVVQWYTDLVTAELNVVEKYADETFEDKQLQEYAISYINLLNKQKDSLQYIIVDFDKWDKMWQDALEGRAELITTINKEYTLTISDEFKSVLDEMLTRTEVAASKDKIEKDLKKALKEAKFEKIKSYDSYDVYLTVENITDKKFEQVEFEISLIDKDGVVVDSDSAYATNWKPGKKVKLEFYSDKDFDKYEVEVEYYELSE